VRTDCHSGTRGERCGAEDPEGDVGKREVTAFRDRDPRGHFLSFILGVEVVCWLRWRVEVWNPGMFLAGAVPMIS